MRGLVGGSIVLGWLMAVSLVSCTSNSLGDLAVQGARQKLEQEYRAEAAEALGKREKFLIKYVEANLQLTHLEAGKEALSGNQAQVQVSVRRPAKAARQALREVMVKVEDWKDTSFNATDAIRMLSQKLNIPDGASDDEVITIQLKKTSDWKLAE